MWELNVERGRKRAKCICDMKKTKLLCAWMKRLWTLIDPKANVGLWTRKLKSFIHSVRCVNTISCAAGCIVVAFRFDEHENVHLTFSQYIRLFSYCHKMLHVVFLFLLYEIRWMAQTVFKNKRYTRCGFRLKLIENKLMNMICMYVGFWSIIHFYYHAVGDRR